MESFFDLQKVFNTLDHNILFHKLSLYVIRDVANYWFSSYLSNRKQFITINEFDSEIQGFRYGVLQGPRLFLIYINDLHNTIKFSQLFHFVDDTYLNKDLKEISFWQIS